MDEITSLLQEKLKVSALSKSVDVSKYARSVTLGPNAGDNEINNLKITIVNKENTEPSHKTAEANKRNYSSQVSQRIFAEAENLRQNEVWKAVENRIRLFKEQERIANSIKNNAKLKSQQQFLERIDQQENALKHELQTIELQVKAESAHLKEVQKLNEQKRSVTKQGIHDEYNQKEKLKLLEKLLTLQSEFREYYGKILKTCEQNQQINDIFKKHSVDIKNWTQSMEKIVHNFTNQNMDENSLENAKELVKNIKDLYKVVVDEINTAIKEKQKPPVKEEIKPIPPVVKAEIKKEPESPQKKQIDQGLSQYVSQKAFDNYRELTQFLRNYEASYQNLLQDEKLKKYRFDCQKAINMPINAITAVNGSHLADKYNRIVKVLTGRVVEVGSSQVSITQHPEALAYCTDLLAKKFVRQGDLTVSSNPKSAFAFAAVIVALWVKFPDFGKLLLANFYRDCIYLVPMYLPKSEGQSNQEYYKALNYRYIDDEVEPQDKFLKRMTGIIRLYAAIMVTKQRQMNANASHPFGIQSGWVLLANILNLPPRLDITATALYNVLDVIGFEMLAKYGRQFRKLINFIIKDYIPRLEQIDTGGPVVRLQVFLNEVQKKGRIEKPEGILPNDFW